MVRKSVFAGLLCLFATAATAAITSISPTVVPFLGSGEVMTINGTDLVGTELTTVVFDGIYEVEPSAASSTALTVVVPIDVTVFEGAHTLEVRSYDALAIRVHGPVTFMVEAEPGSGPPLLTLPEFVVSEAASPAGGTVTFSVSATSAVTGDPVAVTCTPASGSSFPLGFSNVTCSATDIGGTTTGSFIVFVTDFTPPVVTVPANLVTANPVVTFTASAVDNIDGPISVSCVPASGSTFPFGTTTVLCTAIDSHANFGYGTFTVHVSGGPPLLTVPADIVTEATSSAGAIVTFTVDAVDADTVVCAPPSGSTFALGTTTVTCTATNAAGSTSASFSVTVQDTTPPDLALPAVVEAEATSPAGASVAFTATAADLVDGSVPVDCTPASGSFFAFGTTTVTCTATDASGNTSTGTFDVIVQDTTAPEITVATANPRSLWPPNHKMVDVTLTVEATDAVDPSPSIHIVSVTSNQPVDGTGDGDTAPDWVITSPLTLQLRAERAGGVERIYTITVSATDLYGNVSTATVEVRVAGSKSAKSLH